MQAAELLSSQIKLRHMIVVSMIAQRGSIREASEALHLTQPAMSRTLAEVERILGIRLFDRVPKGMLVRDDGAALITRMQFVASEVGALLRHAAEITEGGRGEVSVGTLLAGTADILPSALFEITSNYPDISVAVYEGTPDRLHELLIAGRLDLVVGRVLPLASMPGVDVEPLYDDEVHLVCAPDHRRSGGRSLAELVDEPWILPPHNTSLRQQIEAAFVRECGRTLEHVIECVAPVPLRALVLRGEHLAVVPSGIFADDIERGVLVSLDVDIEGSSVPVGIVTRTGSELPPGVELVVDALRDSARTRTPA